MALNGCFRPAIGGDSRSTLPAEEYRSRNRLHYIERSARRRGECPNRAFFLIYRCGADSVYNFATNVRRVPKNVDGGDSGVIMQSPRPAKMAMSECAAIVSIGGM